MINTLRHLAYGEQLRAGPVYPGEETEGILMYTSIFRVGVKRPNCSVVPSDSTGGNRHKLKQRKFHLNIMRNFFEGGRELEQTAQGDRGVSPGDI